jgi:hypothetical protein
MDAETVTAAAAPAPEHALHRGRAPACPGLRAVEWRLLVGKRTAVKKWRRTGLRHVKMWLCVAKTTYHSRAALPLRGPPVRVSVERSGSHLCRQGDQVEDDETRAVCRHSPKSIT